MADWIIEYEDDVPCWIIDAAGEFAAIMGLSGWFIHLSIDDDPGGDGSRDSTASVRCDGVCLNASIRLDRSTMKRESRERILTILFHEFLHVMFAEVESEVKGFVSKDQLRVFRRAQERSIVRFERGIEPLLTRLLEASCEHNASKRKGFDPDQLLRRAEHLTRAAHSD